MRAKTILSKHETWQLLPHSLAKPQPDYIPEAIREDYQEACAILKLSPKASATLSRRCLQGMVRDFWNIPKGRRGNLGAELNFIKDEIDSDTFDSITVIRETGDIGAHMEKDVNFVVDVEPDEAELLIELIEMLFANWYIAKQKRIDRNKKVREQSAKKLAEKKQAKSASNQSGNDEPAT
ncbi:MAG: DUF4145 domain-containing protein [Robiginitomaculum sp.]|nr:DUF4145 domain-containing protein [Robiginitomaculum sp.]